MRLTRNAICALVAIIFYIAGAFATRGLVINSYLAGNPIPFPPYFPKLVIISTIVGILLLILIPFCALARRWAFLLAGVAVVVDAVAEAIASVETWSIAGVMSPAFIGLLALLVAAFFCWRAFQDLKE